MDNTRSIVPRLGTRQRRGIVAKANRIVDGKRNANIPVDMSDHFYDHGNEYCRYLITDPRSDRQARNVNHSRNEYKYIDEGILRSQWH